MARKITSFDVARAAGVSQPTVSRALRNMPGTAPRTRERVMEAAANLGYVASDSGRSLSSETTHRVAVVSEALVNPYYPELVEPLRKILADRGFRTVLISDATAGAVPVDALADGSYDGVLLTTTRRDSSLPRDLTERGIPHVLVNRVLDHPESDSCAFDNLAGTELICDLLADLGHERIGSIQGPLNTSTGAERAAGVARGLRRRGLLMRREHACRTSFSHDGGKVAAEGLVNSRNPPTALVCGNDVIAFGALSAARQHGLGVPDDLTIVGFDDIAMASWPMVDLTTVRCDLEALARSAVDLLLTQISTVESDPRHVLLPVLMRERGTHGPPP